MNGTSHFGCISISFGRADEAFRGRLAFSKERTEELLSDLPDGISQAVLLCTCLRTELYFCGDADAAAKLLSSASGVERSELLPRTDTYISDKALTHLFRVAGGLRSAVLGEDEILRQVRESYAAAQRSGSTGYELNRIFQAALSCGKRIRCDTEISRIPISTATLAANKAAGYKDRVRVLVIGASGMIGSAVLKDLLGHRNVSAAATVRRCGGQIAVREGVRRVDYEQRYQAIADADCIISATSSPHYTVTLHGLEQHGISGEKLFIDLAVPADIDRGISGKGFELVTIDDIGLLAKQNELSRRFSAEAAEVIVAEELDTLKKELLWRSSGDEIAAALALMSASPQKALYRLKKAMPSDALEKIIKALGGQ